MDEREDDLSTLDRGTEIDLGLDSNDDDGASIIEEVKIEEVGIDGMCGVY